MIDVPGLAGIVFSGLSALVIEDVEDAGGVIVVRAKTRGGAAACPGCGARTSRVHGYHERAVPRASALAAVEGGALAARQIGRALSRERVQGPGVGLNVAVSG
jgi:hypothetical protein